MPKQMIYADNPAFEPFLLAVSWLADHDVQIGIQVADSDLSLLDCLYGGGPFVGQEAESGEFRKSRFVEIGMSLRERLALIPAVTEVDDEVLGVLAMEAVRTPRGPQERDGIWAHLTRKQCNDLINAVRTARDKAYGKDA